MDSPQIRRRDGRVLGLQTDLGDFLFMGQRLLARHSVGELPERAVRIVPDLRCDGKMPECKHGMWHQLERRNADTDAGAHAPTDDSVLGDA